MVRSWSSTVELIGGSGGYLTCPVSPTVPIFAVNPAVAETLSAATGIAPSFRGSRIFRGNFRMVKVLGEGGCLRG